MRVAAVQMRVGLSKDDNLERAVDLIDVAAARGAHLVVLPEYASFLGPPESYEEAAEAIPGPTTALLADKAREHGITIHGGSLIERRTGDDARSYNSSYVVDSRGDLVATYRKVHLFDVAVGDEVAVRESAAVIAGDELVTVGLRECALGLSICYDLRFPELYRALALAGATVMVVPAAFAETTGRVHWEVLLRARAIENGAFVIAAAQRGHEAAWPMFGHSMIVDPWGEVLAVQPGGDGVVFADLDLAQAARRRAQLPVLLNRRSDVYARPVRRAGHLAFWREM